MRHHHAKIHFDMHGPAAGKIAASFLIIAAVSALLNSCCFSNSMKKKTVNIKKEISNGLIKGEKVYFLCEYVLSKPGTTVIPMYMYVPGDVYYDNVILYSFDLKQEKLMRLADLKSVASDTGRGSVKYADWADAGAAIYTAYSTGWDPEKKKYHIDLFRYEINKNSVTEVTGAEKDKIMNTMFPNNKKNIMRFTKIMYHIGYLPENLWQLPSPLDYTSMSEKEKKKAIVEQIGFREFRRALLTSIAGTISRKEADDMESSMKERYDGLQSYQKRMYKPYIEEVSAVLNIMSGKINDDVRSGIITAENAALLEAAFRDDVPKLDHLLKTADINAADKNGCTALMYAIFGSAPHTMEALIKNGADLKKESGSGYIAWMFVSVTGLRQRFLVLTGMGS